MSTNTDKIIKQRLGDLLKFSDNLHIKMQEGKDELIAIQDYIKTAKEDDATITDKVNDYRLIIANGFLLESDLVKSLSELSSIYKIAKLSSLDLELEEKDINRLEFNIQNEHYVFTDSKEGIIPRDLNLIENIRAGFSRNSNFNQAEFINAVKKCKNFQLKD